MIHFPNPFAVETITEYRYKYKVEKKSEVSLLNASFLNKIRKNFF